MIKQLRIRSDEEGNADLQILIDGKPVVDLEYLKDCKELINEVLAYEQQKSINEDNLSIIFRV